MRLFAAATLALTSLFSGAAWAEPVSDSALRFSVTFPAQSEREVVAADPAQMLRRGVIYEARNDDGYFTAAAMQYGTSESWAWNDIGSVFRDVRSECVTSGDVVEERTFQVNGGSGAEVLVRRPIPFSREPVFDLIRYAVRVNRMYCVRATYHDAAGAAPASRFIRSFSAY